MPKTKEAPPKCSTIRPLGDRVLIYPDPTSKETPGGIVLPESSVEKPRTGTVVALGPLVNLDVEAKLAELDSVPSDPLRQGARVLFSPYSGVDVEDGDTLLKLMREEDVMAVMDEED